MIEPLEYTKKGFFEGAPSFSTRIRLERLLFVLTWGLFARWTLPRAHKWRRLILRQFGADIALGAIIYPSVKIWHPRNLSVGERSMVGPSVNLYSMAPIRIGRNVVVSQRSHLCCGTHDISDPRFQLVARPIDIGDDAWICAESFVGPGVKVGEGAVLAARGAAFTDLAEWTVYRGNPASAVKGRTQFDRRG